MKLFNKNDFSNPIFHINCSNKPAAYLSPVAKRMAVLV